MNIKLKEAVDNLDTAITRLSFIDDAINPAGGGNNRFSEEDCINAIFLFLGEIITDLVDAYSILTEVAEEKKQRSVDP